MNGLRKKQDLKSWLKHNGQFHHYFYENCDNENLKILLDTLKRRIYRYQYIIIRVPGHFESYLDFHQNIIDACAHQDGATAERNMKQHLDRIKQVLLDQLKDFPALHPG